MKISIVMPSYNSEAHLNECLQAIAEQSYTNFEVILVDCSDSDAPALIATKYPFVKVIRKQERFNPGQGRNFGVAFAKGAYIVFIDSDVVLDRCALDNIVKLAGSGERAFGGALELHQTHRIGIASDFEHYYFNHENQSSRPLNLKRTNLSSAFLIIEKKLFEAVGGFADIPRMQDTELTERIRHEMNINLAFEPSAIGYQIQDSSLKKVLKKIFITGNNIYFLRYGSNSKGRNILLFFTAPLMALAKATRINVRNLKYWCSLKQLFIIAPSMYVLTFIWMCGLYKGLIKQDGISKNR